MYRLGVYSFIIAIVLASLRAPVVTATSLPITLSQAVSKAFKMLSINYGTWRRNIVARTDYELMSIMEIIAIHCSMFISERRR